METSSLANESATSYVPKRIIHPVRLCMTCPAELAPDQDTWMRQCVECFKDDQTKRNCTVCQRPRIVINDEKWKTVCSECFKNAALKPCSACREPKIKAYETWRTLCKDCYAAKKWKRTCVECGERPIKDDLPSYVKTCTHCYMDKRRKNFSVCQKCPQPNTRLNCRKGAPSCRECMMKDGLIVNSNPFQVPMEMNKANTAFVSFPNLIKNIVV